MKSLFITFLTFSMFLLGSCDGPNSDKVHSSEEDNLKDLNYTQWNSYLGGPDRNHFTQLDQISKDNIQDLEVAWIYSAHDSGQMQINPIIVDSILYGVSAGLSAFAIHVKTGKELWAYGDTEIKLQGTSRGVSYWTDGDESRILYTAGSDLIALNPLSGDLVSSFGKNGRIDLRHALTEKSKDYFVVSNTPGSIYENLIVMPLRVSEGANAAPGYIVAYDVYTGKEIWKFRTIPEPGEYGYETWEMSKTNQPLNIGGANNWSGMSVDHEEGIIYVPTGSASPDFYGGGRKGSNLFANCLLALDAETGEPPAHRDVAGILLTGGRNPAPQLLQVAKNSKTPLMLVKDDTFAVMERLEKMELCRVSLRWQMSHMSVQAFWDHLLEHLQGFVQEVWMLGVQSLRHQPDYRRHEVKMQALLPYHWFEYLQYTELLHHLQI